MSQDNSTESQQQTRSLQEQIRTVIQRLGDLTDLLRSQREMLQQRGMNLPAGSLDALRTLRSRVDGVAKQLVNSSVQLRQLRALAETTSLINSSLDTSMVLNQVMDTVISLTGAERGYIVLKNRETGVLDQFRVARGIDENLIAGAAVRSDESDAQKNPFIFSSTIVKEVARTGEPILTDNATEDERFAGGASIVNFQLRSILAVPLKVRDELIGVVYCDNRILQALFQEHDRDILAAFANQAAVAIENARLFEETRAQLNQVTQMRDMMDNIFNSIVSGVITLDAYRKVLTANQAACRILAQDDPLEEHVGDVFPIMSELFDKTLSEVLNDGNQKLLIEEPDVKSLGKRHWNIIISPLRDTDGNIHGLAMVLDDLTEQKRAEAQLAEVKRYLPPALLDSSRGLEGLNVDEGQERIITMISCDVRGFTTFSELLQPEELMETINKYLSIASDAINLYEGIVDKYMGDAVTGLFNTQINPQEDHAMRGVRAAMNIMYDLYALHEILPENERLFYGIGVHTAQAFLGNVGGEDRKEFSALGDAATISKILEGNAGPGEVIISESTYELIKDFFDCEEREPKNTKGRDDIKKIYLVKKRKKGVKTGRLFLDPEFEDVMEGSND